MLSKLTFGHFQVLFMRNFAKLFVTLNPFDEHNGSNGFQLQRFIRVARPLPEVGLTYILHKSHEFVTNLYLDFPRLVQTSDSSIMSF